MHTDVAILSVHADVTPQTQCSDVHHVLLTVDTPRSHVRGENRSMPHERPYRPTAAPWTKAATPAPRRDTAASTHE